MKEGFARRDVAQCRGAEEAAILGAIRVVGPERAADAEIEIGRVVVGGDSGVARQAQRDLAVVAELRCGSLGAGLAEMAGGAVALVLSLEKREATGFGGGEVGLSGQVGVVLAGVGKEVLPFLLVDLERLQDRIEAALVVVEDAGAVDRGEVGP